jgi:hypothetical protein
MPLLSFMMLLVYVGMVAPLSAQTSSLPAPVGWWEFSETSGTTAADVSGNGHAATMVNGASWTAGKTGNAVVADGSNQYVSIPAIDLSGTQAITWTAWINRTYSSSGGHVLFEDSANFNSSTTGFGFFPDGDPGSNCLGLAIGVHGNAGYTVNCYAQPSSGVWHHVGVVLDKSQPGAQTISLYIDGQKQTATGQSYTVTNTNGFGIDPLYLFSRGGTAAYSAGAIDDLQLYAQALSAAQVQQIYQQDLASLVSLTVTPANASIIGGTARQFNALGTYSDDSTQNLTASVAWSSSDASVATIASSGLATAIAAGSTTIQAVSGGVSNSTTVTVTAPVLVSISVAPSSASTTIGGSQQFTAAGIYNNGASQNLTANVAWSVTDSAIATVSATGMATGVSYGSTKIQASLGSFIGSASFTVSSLSLQSITITPAKPQVAVSATLQLIATGTYADGTTQDLTSQVTWSSTDSTIASITSFGLATGIGTGSTTLNASLNSSSGSIPLTVTPSGLTGWWAFNEGSGTTASDSSGHGYDATLYNGMNWTTGQTGGALFANGVNQYISIPSVNLSSTQAVTLAAWIDRTWSNSGPTVLIEASSNFNSVSDGFGVFVDDGTNCGISSAIFAGVRGDGGYALSCYAAPSSGRWHHLALECDKSKSGNQQVSLYVDGVLQTPVSSPYTTTNSNTFGNQPFYLFARGGAQYYTSATIGDLRLYNRALSVAEINQIYGLGASAVSLQSLAVSPASASITTGSTQQFTAQGTYSDGSTQNLTASVTWSSSNTTAATIDSSGLATTLSTGSTTIQAVSGTVRNSASLTVTAPILASLSVTPANPIIQVGSGQQFIATGTYNNGVTQDLTASAAWSAANSAIATISAAGMATGISSGSTAVQATLGAITGQANLRVSSGTLQSIAITPSNPQVAVAAGLQFTATGTYSDGSTQDLTSLVTWSASDSKVASITSYGLVTGIGTGATALLASLNASSGSINLTVTPSGLTGWWPFNEGSGTTASDSSGHGYNATLFNGMNWTTGQTGGAVSANGVNQYMATPSINLSSTQAFTLAAWVNRTWSNSGPSALVEASDNYNSVSNGFTFIADDASDCGISSAIVMGVRGDNGYTLNCYAAPSSNGWHHLVVLCDKSQPGNNQLRLYIDDVLQTPVATPYGVNNSNTFGNQPFYLFSRAGSQYFSAGEVSDLRIYNRILSAAEIGQLYDLGFSTANSSLQSLAVTPVDSSIVLGNTEQLTATGTYTDGSTRNLNNTVNWSSSNSAVATIASGGLATGIAAGSTVIQAASGSIAASANLAVVSRSSAPAKFVQSCAGDGGATTKVTTSMPNIVTSGNLIVVFVHWDNQAATATASDQLGNTYVPIFPPTDAGSSARFQVWYVKNVTGGVPLSVTVNFSQATTSFSVLDAMEYSGIDTTSPLDGFNSATGRGTSQNSGSILVPNANSEILIGLFGYDVYALTYTAGPGFTMQGYEASTMIEDQAAVTAGTYAATATSNTTANWAAFVMAFKYAVQ